MRNLALALTLSAKDAASKILRQAMQDGIKQTQAAQKAGDGLAKSQQQNAATGIRASRTLSDEYRRASSARSTLGIRSEREIQREIQQTQAAYARLTRSGVMSANEQSRAFAAMTQRVGRLRDELKGAGNEMSRMDRARGWGSNAMAIAGGVTAAGAVVAQPVKNQMSYDRRISMMANTAYAERGIQGRLEGKKELAGLVKNAVTLGGGTKESAADTLDAMLASGAVSMDSVKTLLPVIQKYATATGADPKDLANIAIRLKQTFDIKDEEVGKALNMAIVAGQEGSFELADMAKYLPGQLASASSAGMRGLDDFSTLLALNQTSAITAGNSDEAGNNAANLLAKLNSRDTAMALAKIKYNGKGIDLSGSLAHAKGKGINSVDAFVGIVDKVVSGDKKYQELQNQLHNAKGGKRAQILESMANILEGSSVGKVIADQQALKALIGYRANREYAKEVVTKSNAQRNLKEGESAGDINFAVMSDANDLKVEKFNNAKDFAQMDSIKPLSDVLGGLSANLADYAQKYPGLTTALSGAEIGIKAMTAAAVVFAGIKFFSGGSPGGISAPPTMPGGVRPAGALGRALGTMGRLAGRVAAPFMLYQASQDAPLVQVERGDADARKRLEANQYSDDLTRLKDAARSQPGLLDAWDEAKSWWSSPTSIGKEDIAAGGPTYLMPQQNQKPQPLQVTTKLVVDERVLAETVNEYNNGQAGRGQMGPQP